ncbi:endo-1,4-beta-xylanase [Treponema succinifaciens]|uniref:endo-1,4-beta-xylanase n=1 Tax=Treponema succinifaciens TaxID=167 RepID=UPI003FCD1173
MKNQIHFFIALFFTVLLCSCGKSFKYAAKDNGFYSGMAVNVGDIFNPETIKILQNDCSIIVYENSMKWANLRPNKNFWNWNDIDSLVEFAEKNNMRVKWHTLFWHQQNSPFVSSSWTREQAIQMMNEHIETIMSRYKGKIAEYDVVNEMFNEDGSMRQNIWYKTIGADYIELALKKAHQVDPDAKLLLNEFNNEEKGHPKADAMYNLVKNLKERGIPIDGVGMQLHLDARISYSEDAIRQNIQRYEDLGIAVSFSEVDVRIPIENSKAYESAQENIYLMLYKIASEMPNVTSFITWGISDKHSWVPSTFPGTGNALLYDEDFKPKPVYNAILKELKK